MNILEENVKLSIPKTVFYNEHMRFCRSMSSLLIGALGGELRLLDGMSASGVRGIRYASENGNVKKIVFVDMNKYAVNAIKTNVTRNKKQFAKTKALVIREDINFFMHENLGEFNFIELDPFGSPAPFLFDALRCLSPSKHSFLSVTATDTAVLCGAHAKACVKNYGAKPLNNEFTHETGVRILLSNIARTAASFNLATKPLFTLSKRHYFKLFVSLEKGAEKAVESAKKASGFVVYCPKCLHREAVKSMFSSSVCPICGGRFDFAGPLWSGELFGEEILKKMIESNEERNYSDKRELASVLNLMLEEAPLPAFYFDLHKIFKKYSLAPIKTQAILDALRARSFKVSRTHFAPTAIKTDAGIEELKKTMV